MKTYTQISKHNYLNMLLRAARLNRSYLEKRFWTRLATAYVEQLKPKQAERDSTPLFIADKDYAKLMVLASYAEGK